MGGYCGISTYTGVYCKRQKLQEKSLLMGRGFVIMLGKILLL